jgi:hypothetical protein
MHGVRGSCACMVLVIAARAGGSMGVKDQSRGAQHQITCAAHALVLSAH